MTMHILLSSPSGHVHCIICGRAWSSAKWVRGEIEHNCPVAPCPTCGAPAPPLPPYPVTLSLETAKRDIFDEIMEGIEALACEREAKTAATFTQPPEHQS